MFKNTFDVALVWIVTIIANFWVNLVNVLPIISLILTIISLLIAITFSLYRFARSWAGWRPWLNKDGTNRNINNDKESQNGSPG